MFPLEVEIQSGISRAYCQFVGTVAPTHTLLRPNARTIARKTAFELQRIQTEAMRELEWRIALGRSPNPWGGDSSSDPANEDLGRTRVMQIISRHKLSKLEQRSLTEKDSQ